MKAFFRKKNLSRNPIKSGYPKCMSHLSCNIVVKSTLYSSKEVQEHCLQTYSKLLQTVPAIKDIVSDSTKSAELSVITDKVCDMDICIFTWVKPLLRWMHASNRQDPTMPQDSSQVLDYMQLQTLTRKVLCPQSSTCQGEQRWGWTAPLLHASFVPSTISLSLIGILRGELSLLWAIS